MRPIKFRAWHKHNNGNGEPFMTEPFNLYQLTDGAITFEKGDFVTWLNSCELMQFTGLLDKSGKEIYEGDITKTPEGATGKVIWNSKFARFEWSDGANAWPLNDEKFNYGPDQDEVIGNIYENPELLTSKQ
jgi:uncharacterized phage protein (TIGR01671 family)